MNSPNYHTGFTANATAEQAFRSICNVANWWATDFEGQSEKQGDQFTIRFGPTRTDFLTTEVIPNSKITWLVTDCHLHWLNDTKEWLGHTMIFDMVPKGEQVQVNFTQVGLTPIVECYNDCEKGWNFFIGESLRLLIETGVGKPDTSKDKR